jgi:hypothetical protein
VVTTSTITVAFEWPSASTAQLVVSIRRRAGPTPQSLALPYTCGGKQAQTDMVRELLKAGADVRWIYGITVQKVDVAQ